MATTNYYKVDDRIIGEREVTGLSFDYLPDSLGSIIISTDGSTVNSTGYTPYGIGSEPVGASIGWVGVKGYRPTALAEASHYVRRRTYSRVRGCWTSRDPLWPYQRSHSFVRGNPLRYLDSAGMTPTPLVGSATCADPDDCTKDPCGYAIRHQDPRQIGTEDDLTAAPGFVACCKGLPYVCTNPGVLGPKAPPGALACVHLHEGYHKPHVHCTGAPDGEAPPLNPMEECAAYIAEINCLLEAKWRLCNQSGVNREQCYNFYDDYIKGQPCCLMCETYQCPGFMIPSICDCALCKPLPPP